MTRRGLRGAATILMVAATAACAPGLVPPAHTTGPSLQEITPTTSTPASATSTTEPATPPATLTPHLAPPPPGTQWAANSIVHLRFAVPNTWTVLDPTKLHGADFVNPAMRQMAARLGVSPDQMAAQVSRARIFTVSNTRPPADIVMTDLPVAGMLTDASIAQQFADLTGTTKNIHISRGHSPGVGPVTQVSLAIPIAGRAPLQSDAGIFSTSEAVFMVFVTAADRPTADRLYNQAISTMDLY